MLSKIKKKQFLLINLSVGVNIRDAFYGHGRADFIAKLQIALKECSESEYWIELLIESGYYDDRRTFRERPKKDIYKSKDEKSPRFRGIREIFSFILHYQCAAPQPQ